MFLADMKDMKVVRCEAGLVVFEHYDIIDDLKTMATYMLRDGMIICTRGYIKVRESRGAIGAYFHSMPFREIRISQFA
jgi:hypothetical protein